MATSFLSRFTPSLMDAKTLESVFVQRERLAQRIVETIRDNAQTAARSHTLLVGPRGIGKTHLLSLIYYRLIGQPELIGSLRIAWLREEEWGVSSFLDLLLRILRALSEEDLTLQPEIASLYTQTQAQATRAARTLLENTLCSQPLLLMAENLDDLFAGLGTSGQQAFRSFLQETGLVTILATAQGLFADVSRQSAPFYGFFRVEHLPGLSLDEAVALLTKIAALDEGDTLEDSQSLTAYLKTPTGRARVRAVHHLAGGNPRVYVIFSEFLTRESLDELVSPFLKMLDELTPYYQARMQWISAQQRKIVEILVEARGAISVKDIAQRGFMTHQTASSQLKELRNKGYVQSQSVGRESFYELQEPLMRLCLEVKKQRGEPIKLFVEFLRIWWSKPEIEHRLALLSDDADFTKRCLQEALRLSQNSKNPIRTAVMRDMKMAMEQKDQLKILETVEEITEIEPRDAAGWFIRGLILSELERNNEALSCLEKSAEIDPHSADLWFWLGRVLTELDNNSEAIKAFGRALEIAPDDVETLQLYGMALAKSERFEEALIIFTRLTKLAPSETWTWVGYGLVLSRLEKDSKALTSYNKAIKLSPDTGFIWEWRGHALAVLGRSEEALDSFEKAIILGHITENSKFNRIFLLMKLKRWHESFALLDEILLLYPEQVQDLSTFSEKAVAFYLTLNVAEWQEQIKPFVDRYVQHDAVSVLGEALVQTIPKLKSLLISPASRGVWLATWQEALDGQAEADLPLRLLETAIRYWESGEPPDERILLELPVEQRDILRPLVTSADTTEA